MFGILELYHHRIQIVLKSSGLVTVMENNVNSNVGRNISNTRNGNKTGNVNSINGNNGPGNTKSSNGSRL